MYDYKQRRRIDSDINLVNRSIKTEGDVKIIKFAPNPELRPRFFIMDMIYIMLKGRQP